MHSLEHDLALPRDRRAAQGDDPADAVQDRERLAALRQTALLDGPAEAAFDRLTRLATTILSVPIALVSLVDEDREFFKSCIGLPEPWASRREVPLSHSFCQHAVASGEPLVIADARQHPLVRDNLAIPDLGVVAYAGIPLITSDGHVLGTLCAIDSQPRRWTEAEVAILGDLAASVMTEIELRTRTRAADAAQERVASILASTADAFFTLDTDWRFTYVNRQAELVLQHRGEELVGQTIWQVFPDAVGSIFYAEYHRAVAEQISVTFDAHYPPLDSWVEVRAYPSRAGLSVYVRDIAERRQAEAERERLLAQLQAAEAHYRGLFESAADAILVADGEGRYLDANPAAGDLLGYSRDELLQLRVADVVAAGLEWTEAEYARFLRDGHWQGELEVRRQDGTLVPVEARATTLELPTGTLYRSTLRDISERRALERLQHDFLALVTHELKSPLTSIRAYADLMERRAAYNARGIEAIRSQAQRLERLINDLLDVSQLQAGRLDLQCEPADLATLVDDAAAEARLLSEAHEIVVEQPAQPLIGCYDRDRLMQIMDNVLVNAVKYSPPGSSVRVRVDDLGQAARVSVSDQGSGIPAEALPHVFDRFYRTPGAAASGVKGLGLGLYITRQLVEAHGGRIWVESSPGQGSAFIFTLPYQRPATGAGRERVHR